MTKRQTKKAKTEATRAREPIGWVVLVHVGNDGVLVPMKTGWNPRTSKLYKSEGTARAAASISRPWSTQSYVKPVYL